MVRREGVEPPELSPGGLRPLEFANTQPTVIPPCEGLYMLFLLYIPRGDRVGHHSYYLPFPLGPDPVPCLLPLPLRGPGLGPALPLPIYLSQYCV
jgi:hypothetical protein